MLKITQSDKSDKLNSTINFSTVWKSDYWLNSNGMYCGFNMPESLVSKDNNGEETSHELPPYARRKAYLVDEYPCCPKNWVRSEGRKTSYFVPVKEDHGMWLDFNRNWEHKYEVAIVISVQGINPITGLPCIDAGLEQYIDTCPKHKISFGPNRYCEKCGYKWPKQNYICTTGSQHGGLWLDGFRTAEGIVRQYILTMDKIKGVASNIIKEDRVFSVGISFFLSNEPKQIQQSLLRSRVYNAPTFFSSVYTPSFEKDNFQLNSLIHTKSTVTYDSNDIKTYTTNDNTNYEGPCAEAGSCCSEPDQSMSYVMDGFTRQIKSSNQLKGIVNTSSLSQKFKAKDHINNYTAELSARPVDVKKVEVGAGANIGQAIGDDPQTLDFWRKEPEAITILNYVTEEDCLNIIKGGKISLEGHKESFLKDIPVGNKQ